MSAFQLPPEHVGALVQAGAVLQLGPLPWPDETAPPDITTVAGQRVVFRLLWDQHVAGLLDRYPESAFSRSNPVFPAVPVALRTDADLIQVLQWVRCYEYQSCAGWTWSMSFARQYCTALSRVLVDALMARHCPTWVFECSRRE